jgi:hypothetical protein
MREPSCNQPLLALIGQTPPDCIVDWKLAWRDPSPRWTSPGGIVVQLGDAAHAFLPSSANGGTQACEDGSSLAVCLELAGKKNVALATRVYYALRYVSRISSIVLALPGQGLLCTSDASPPWQACTRNRTSSRHAIVSSFADRCQNVASPGCRAVNGLGFETDSAGITPISRKRERSQRT